MNWYLDSNQQSDAVIQNITKLFQRQIKERCGQELPVLAGKLASEKPASASNRRLVLRVDPSIMGAESFSIENGASDSLWVIGHDARGLLYGVGKLLHTSSFSPGAFEPGNWRGHSKPVLPLRGIYFATHFHNWHHVAPLEEVERYIEEMALWGTNTLSIWFDQHHYQGIADPQAQAMLERLIAILSAARRIGLNTSATLLANEGYASSPAALRADWHPGHNGYHHEPVGHYHVEVCPSKPGGMELALRWAEEKLEVFKKVGLDYLWIWPYDQGGCTCRECAPWGVNGFLRLAEPIARMYRGCFPNGKVILSTWYFDHFIDGEWEGLAQAFQHKPDWVDILLADDNADIYPPYPLKNGIPGGFPLVSFPEISMYNCNPWGGYGANPFPAHLQALWNQTMAMQHRSVLSGGFPYSEGMYEDINKAICAQFFWDPSKPAAETVKEYIAYEYSPQVVDTVSAAIDILEYNLPRGIQKAEKEYRFPMQHSRDVERCWQLVQDADLLLAPARRACWRWRVLYLRALIDRELASSNGFTTPGSEAAFEELTALYHAENASLWMSPPTRAALAARREADYLDV